MKSKYSVCLLLLGIVTNTFAGYSSGYPMDKGYGSDYHPRQPFPAIWGRGPNRNVNAPIEVEDESSIEDPSESQDRNPFQGMQLPPGLSPGNEPSSQFTNPDEGPDSDLESNENLGQNPFPQGQNPFAQGRNPFPQGQNPSPQGQNPFPQGQNPFPQGQNPFAQGKNPFAQGQNPFPQGQNPSPQGQNPFPQGQNPSPQGQNPLPPSQNPFAQGPNPFAQGQNPFAQGQNPFPQSQNPSPQGQNPLPPGQNPFAQGPNPVAQGQNPFSQGQNPFPTSENQIIPDPEMEPETSVENRQSNDPSAAIGILARNIKNKIIFYENVGNKDFGLIQVDVFFDGLCRKSRDFIVNHLFPAWKEFGDVFYINFVPFSGKYRGNPENQALDTQLAVIINNVPVEKKKMHLIRCLMDYSRKGRDQMQVLKYCSKICHIDEPLLNKIVDAINKPDAPELLEHARTLALAKEVENIPAVFIDGVKKYKPKCLKHFKQTIIERATEKGLEDLIQLTNMNQMIDSPLINSDSVERPATPRATKNIAEIVVGDARFSTLLAAVKAAGLVETLSGEGPFTVFAPTNDAFAKIPPFALNDLLANTEALKAVLLRHVVPAKVPSSDIPFGITSVGTAGGEKITVRRDNRGIMIASSAGSAKVIIADVCATNGVIHAIDYVL